MAALVAQNKLLQELLSGSHHRPMVNSEYADPDSPLTNPLPCYGGQLPFCATASTGGAHNRQKKQRPSCPPLGYPLALGYRWMWRRERPYKLGVAVHPRLFLTHLRQGQSYSMWMIWTQWEPLSLASHSFPIGCFPGLGLHSRKEAALPPRLGIPPFIQSFLPRGWQTAPQAGFPHTPTRIMYRPYQQVTADQRSVVRRTTNVGYNTCW